MTSPQPTRRTGLGRRVADIVQPVEPEESDSDPGRLLGGPEVIPLDLVPFAMLIADSTGQVRALNQRWLVWSGLALEESLGSGWLASVYPHDRTSLQALVEQVARTGVPVRREYPWPGGGDRWVEWSVSAHEQAGERLIGITVHPAPGSPPPDPPIAEAAPASTGTDAATGNGHARGPAPQRVVFSDDPVLRELPALLRSVDALIATLERVVERLPQPQLLPA